MAKTLPTITTTGFVRRDGKGLVVVRCVISGDRVISHELVHDTPEPAPFAVSRALAELRRIYEAVRAEIQ